MAIKASNQITLIDLTDGYSVIMTNENYTFLGTTNSVSGQQITTTTIQAMRGDEVVACTVPQSIATGVNGLSIVSDGKSPSPTLTITATSALTKSGSVIIPVTIGEVVISKTFSYTIAFKGATGQAGTSVGVKSTSVTYQVSTSGTVQPTGSWEATIPVVPQGQYLWTKTVVTYTDGKSTTAYSVSRQGVNGSNGQNGTSVTITNTAVTYQVSTSGTSTPTGAWVASVPAVPQGQYLWTKTVVTYSDGKSTTSYSVSRQGVNGTNGKDALSMVVISSNGSIFKNTNIATTLSAHVYKGGIEVTGGDLTALGTIKWYKDAGTSPVATGQNLTINPGDVKNNANYTAQLEG